MIISLIDVGIQPRGSRSKRSNGWEDNFRISKKVETIDSPCSACIAFSKGESEKLKVVSQDGEEDMTVNDE